MLAAGMPARQMVSRFDGVILFAGAIIYTVFVIRKSRRETRESKAQFAQAFDKEKDVDKGPKQIAIQMAMIVGGTTTLVLIISGMDLPFGLDQNIYGITSSLITFMMISRFRKNKISSYFSSWINNLELYLLYKVVT